MKKQDLRPIEIRRPNYEKLIEMASNYSEEVTEMPDKFVETGWFHGFDRILDDDGIMATFALVELNNGHMVRWPALEITFTDRY